MVDDPFRLVTLQEIRSIATKSIATVIFRCDIIKNYHKLFGCGDRTLVFPRLFLVAINYHFVAVEAAYCNDLHRGWNTIAFLRQRSSVARGSNFVALKARSSNVISMRGNIQTYIATYVCRCISFKYCCKKLSNYCNQIYSCGNIMCFSPQFYSATITIVYCDNLGRMVIG